jgi:hypothetical protein
VFPKIGKKNPRSPRFSVKKNPRFPVEYMIQCARGELLQFWRENVLYGMRRRQIRPKKKSLSWKLKSQKQKKMEVSRLEAFKHYREVATARNIIEVHTAKRAKIAKTTCGHVSGVLLCSKCAWICGLETRMLDRAKANEKTRAEGEMYEKYKSLMHFLKRILADYQTLAQKVDEMNARMYSELQRIQKLILKLLVKFKTCLDHPPEFPFSALIVQGWKDYLMQDIVSFKREMRAVMQEERALLMEVHDVLFDNLVKLQSRPLFKQITSDLMYALDLDMIRVSPDGGGAWRQEKIKKESETRRSVEMEKQRFHSNLRLAKINVASLQEKIAAKVEPSVACPRTWGSLRALQEFLQE